MASIIEVDTLKGELKLSQTFQQIWLLSKNRSGPEPSDPELNNIPCGLVVFAHTEKVIEEDFVTGAGITSLFKSK